MDGSPVKGPERSGKKMWVYPTVHVNISDELIDHSSIMDFSLHQASICPTKPAEKEALRHDST